MISNLFLRETIIIPFKPTNTSVIFILQIVHFEGKGRGVVASKPFIKGQFVVEYDGDLIDTSSAKTREKKYAADSDFGCYMYHFIHKNKGYW